LTPIATVIALVLVVGLAFIPVFSEYIVEIFPSLKIVSSLIVLGVLIFLTTYFNDKKAAREDRYVKKIIFRFEEWSTSTSIDWGLYLLIGAFSIYAILKIEQLFIEKY